MSVADDTESRQSSTQLAPDSGTGSVGSRVQLSRVNPGTMSSCPDSDEVDSAFEQSDDAGSSDRLTVWIDGNLRGLGTGMVDESGRLTGRVGPLDTTVTRVCGMPGRRLRRPFSFSAVEQSLSGLDSTVSAYRVSQTRRRGY